MNPQNMINQNLALSISLDFDQLVMLILQLNPEQRLFLQKMLKRYEKEDKPIGSLRGKLSISQFRNEQNSKTTWEDIEGKWEGEETDEEINEALRKLS